MRYLHILTILGALVGGTDMFTALSNSTVSAPQQAAAAAMAIAWVALPYCCVHAILAIAGSAEEHQLKQLNTTIENHTRLLAHIANTANETGIID